MTAGPTARNRSAHAWASVAKSTGSSPGGGGRESNLASHSMSSTSWRSRRLSPWMRVSASRYSAASRGLDRATSASARITLSGVRSSCEASAVNSSWRRRDCSTGASARRPTTSEPKNIASRTNGPAMSSAYSSSRSVCASPVRLWPAISQPVPWRAVFSRNAAAEPTRAVKASPSRGGCAVSRPAGSAGAPRLCAVTVPAVFAAHTKTGVASSSASSSALAPVAAGRAPSGSARWLSSAGSCATAARRSARR